jgi:hypothetical protein
MHNVDEEMKMKMKQKTVFEMLQKVLMKTPKPLSHLKHVCMCSEKKN